MSRPNDANFLFWLPMQELSGTRYDVSGNAHHALASGWGSWSTPGRAAGHVQGGAADFERSGSNHNLIIPDASWQSGDKDICAGGWVYFESRDWIIMAKGGNGSEVCNFVLFDNGNYIYFEVGDADNGYAGADGKGYNNSYPAADTGWAPSTGTWYYIIWFHDASADTSYIWIYNTSGSLVASDSTGIYCTWQNNNSPYGISFGSGGNETYPSWPLSINSDKPDGRLEQWFMYEGALSSAERTWLVNGGAGRTWTDLSRDNAGIPVQFFKDIRNWLSKDGSLRMERIVEELWHQNQAGLPLPVRS